jgi:formyltetrahydrofolate hydrolase
MPTPETAILLIDCPDRKGIVVTIVNFLIDPNWRDIK